MTWYLAGYTWYTPGHEYHTCPSQSKQHAGQTPQTTGRAKVSRNAKAVLQRYRASRAPHFSYPEVAQRHIKPNAKIELKQSLGLTYGALRSLKGV